MGSSDLPLHTGNLSVGLRRELARQTHKATPLATWQPVPKETAPEEDWSLSCGSEQFKSPVVAELPIHLGGAKELGIVYINIIRGAKEPRNLQNHRGVKNEQLLYASSTSSWSGILSLPSST